jgi:hypothetical protein
MSRRPMALLIDPEDPSQPILSELGRRRIPFDRINPRDDPYDPAEQLPAYGLIFNLLSMATFARSRTKGMLFTLGYLANLERLGIPVVNGLSAFTYESSKARQLMLLQSLGLPYPRAVVVNRADQAPAVAEEALRFPVMVRPNAGPGGQTFETAEELARAAEGGTIDLGVDHTALVQELVPFRPRSFVRLETLGGRLLYAVKGDGSSAAVYAPPDHVAAAGEAAVQAAGIDIGGISYGIDDRDGGLVYLDMYTGTEVTVPAGLGFDPFEKVADFLERVARAGRVFRPDKAKATFFPDAEYWGPEV